MSDILKSLTITTEVDDNFKQILTPEALAFVARLEGQFSQRRRQLLARRQQVQAEIDAGKFPDFLADTTNVRNGDWQVAAIPDDLQKRRVEITGPVDRKMMINALNSGADVFMADFEDANSPGWYNVVQGQINLRDTVDRTISFTNPQGKKYQLKDKIATLLVRPRGWHLDEKHVCLGGQPISASLFDFGLYFFHNCKKLLDQGSGPYFYLPKLESHLEARLWNEVFIMAQQELGIDPGTIKATVLLENILCAFEMEEILYELRDHCAGLNAGRWDYIFSAIKKFRNQEAVLFPDRGQIGMTVPFMRAYTELLVKTCHRRGAHAIGGMAAFIPSKDPKVNEIALAKVREDKVREAGDGFDGTWIAHPGLVEIARTEFDKVLGEHPHQKHRRRDEVTVSAKDLLNFTIAGGQITEQGLRHNISVALQYIESWLRGIGAAAIYNLMEDVATAEISRSQVWQWLHHPKGILADGRKVTMELCQQVIAEELEKIAAQVNPDDWSRRKFPQAKDIFVKLISEKEFIGFLTLESYAYLD